MIPFEHALLVYRIVLRLYSAKPPEDPLQYFLQFADKVRADLGGVVHHYDVPVAVLFRRSLLQQVTQ